MAETPGTRVPPLEEGRCPCCGFSGPAGKAPCAGGLTACRRCRPGNCPRVPASLCPGSLGDGGSA